MLVELCRRRGIISSSCEADPRARSFPRTAATYATTSITGSRLRFCSAATAVAQSAEVSHQVPRDALGLVVVPQSSEIDAKAGRVLGTLRLAAAGATRAAQVDRRNSSRAGQRRDLMVVLLPPQSESGMVQPGAVAPVKDYDALVHSLDGDPRPASRRR